MVHDHLHPFALGIVTIAVVDPLAFAVIEATFGLAVVEQIDKERNRVTSVFDGTLKAKNKTFNKLYCKEYCFLT